jgi:hypothetical protein
MGSEFAQSPVGEQTGKRTRPIIARSRPHDVTALTPNPHAIIDTLLLWLSLAGQARSRALSPESERDFALSMYSRFQTLAVAEGHRHNSVTSLITDTSTSSSLDLMSISSFMPFIPRALQLMTNDV